MASSFASAGAAMGFVLKGTLGWLVLTVTLSIASWVLRAYSKIEQASGPVEEAG
jgi:hypothetical protein